MAYSATAAVVREPGGPFSLERVELDALRENEVLVRIQACGICHTDAKFQSRVPLPGEEFPFSTRELFERVGSLHGIVQGSAVPREFLPRLMELQRAGRFPYERLISTYDFADINSAFADLEEGTAIKPVLVFPED